MIGASVLVWVLALNGTLGRMEGVVLFAGMLIYLGFLIWQSRRERNAAVEAEYAQEYAPSETRSTSAGSTPGVESVRG